MTRVLILDFNTYSLFLSWKIIYAIQSLFCRAIAKYASCSGITESIKRWLIFNNNRSEAYAALRSSRWLHRHSSNYYGLWLKIDQVTLWLWYIDSIRIMNKRSITTIIDRLSEWYIVWYRIINTRIIDISLYIFVVWSNFCKFHISS